MLYLETNQYNNYSVKEVKINDKKGTGFFINNSFASFLQDNGKIDGYIKKMHDFLFKELKLKNKEILVIGAGGFLISQNNENKNNFTYIDIDPKIKEIAEKHFLNKKVEDKFVAEDARAFLIGNEKMFDVVILDAFSSELSIPEHLSTVEFFSLINKSISENGVMVVNSIQDFGYETDFSKNMNSTINAEFNYCYNEIVRDEGGLEVGGLINLVYFCFKKENDDVYKDDLNNANLDFWNLNDK